MNIETRQEIIEKYNIDIDLLLEDLKATQKTGVFDEFDEDIIGLCLLGYTCPEIAQKLLGNTSKEAKQNIRDHLTNYIYPRLLQLMAVEKRKEFTQNWAKWARTLNFLRSPHKNKKYKLDPPIRFNDDNFQSSFGNQFFILSGDQIIIQEKIAATEFYQSGLFYQASRCFLSVWKKEKELYGLGNPETLIYFNNSFIEQYKNELEKSQVKAYTLAVVVPFYHNQGKIATEILRGIAQIQSLINNSIYKGLPNLEYIEELGQQFFGIKENTQKIVIKILVVNEPNNIHFPTNKTAEKLCELSSQLNIIAVLGHYSSEMTKKAIPIYAQHGLVLLNFSSTSNELSHLSIKEKLSFYRLTTQDSIAGKNLVDYLTTIYQNNETQNTAIIYTKNSSYSQSYTIIVRENLNNNITQFNLLRNYHNLGADYHEIRSYLAEINKNNVNIIFLIPDGGIEPNSLNNMGLISRLNVNNCLIAGSATFYQENVINWIDELDRLKIIDVNSINIIACVPWHFNSQTNGVNSNNNMAQNFCKLGRELWGENNLTWRSATAFDAVLTVFRTLERYPINHYQELAEKMDVLFKREKKIINGVTGTIEFSENGDRINPPTEIVKIKFNTNRQKWEWDVV